MAIPSSLETTFANPPREYGIMPFWFWNDDLDEAEILRQIRAFHAKEFGGFIPHARTGLSRRVGYLTDEFFRLMRLAVAEAARLKMKVVLYDEGSYPSGSAQGRVVAENPSYAARCLIAKHLPIEGPAQGYWHPNPGRAMQDKLVCVVLGKEIAPNVLDPESLTCLEILEPELVRYEVPAGNWRLVACWHVFSGGTIRGVFDEEEDGHALAPAAGDLMNEDAVACFIRHTHDQYYHHLQAFFGETIVALFTDEPSPLGRGPKRGPAPWPFTEGFLADVQLHWNEDVTRWLPALWLDCGPQTEAFRHLYTRSVHARLERTFYSTQSRWCVEHGIALTGHPSGSNELGVLRQFQWPGQDMVWRWVTPNSASALAGEHSAAPKCASSAAVLQQSRRNGSEALGAYGWHLTLDEVKWLLDWHLVRGNNLFFLHACFYSIRGRRAFESEPDIALHNVWWPYFDLITNYLRRLCWLLTDGITICEVAILSNANQVGWQAARVLYQNQIDFIYMGSEHLEAATQDADQLRIGQHRFRAVVLDEAEVLTTAQQEKLDAWQKSGGLVIDQWHPETLAERLTDHLGRDLDWPHQPDLRVIHYRKSGHDFYLCVNEGETTLEGALSLASVGGLTLWDPLDGRTRIWPGRIANGRLETRLRLERRQGIVLAVDPQGKPISEVVLLSQPGDTVVEISGPWQAKNDEGKTVSVPCPDDWAKLPDWELFSGRLSFQTQFTLSPTQAEQPLFLDLGHVGDIAEAFINGQRVGLRAWEPYVFSISNACQSGANTLEVRVTNSMANAYEGLQMPSGILGPVVLRSSGN